MNQKWQTATWIFLIFLIIFAFSAASYFYGSGNNVNLKAAPTTPSSPPVPTANETTPKLIPESSPSATATQKPEATVTPVPATPTSKLKLNPDLQINGNLKLVSTSTPTPIPSVKFEIRKDLLPLIKP